MLISASNQDWLGLNVHTVYTDLERYKPSENPSHRLFHPKKTQVQETLDYTLRSKRFLVSSHIFTLLTQDQCTNKTFRGQ